MLAIDPSIAIAVGGISTAACYLFIRTSRRQLQRYFDQIGNSRLALQITIGEGLGALKHIKLRGLEAHVENEFAIHAEQLASAETGSELVRDLPRPLFELFAASLLIVATMALLRTYSSTMILPILALAGAITIRMLPMVNAFTAHVGLIRSNIGSLTRVARALRELEVAQLVTRSSCSTLQAGDIVFQDVEYRYPGQQKSVLRELDLTISRGQTIGLVGQTGSGKSTIVDVMLGFLTPCRGEVSVGGVRIADDLRAWGPQVGYVPQSIFLLDASVLRNVALGMPPEQVEEASVWRALEQAQLAEFVAALPDGLHTHVGERGVRLSGGQRQRLGIARALIHDPAVLILDEATAALDNATERKLLAALQQRLPSRTTVMVAHRLSSVRLCDRIFLVKNGRIESVGTYQELLATSAEFRDLAIEAPS